MAIAQHEPYPHGPKLFDALPLGIVYQDNEGRIESANPAAEKILGLSLDQMRGVTSVDRRWQATHEDGSQFPGEEHPAMVALRTRQPVLNVVMGVFNPKIEAQTWINVRAFPIEVEAGGSISGVYTLFEDITEMREAEELLRLHSNILSSLTEGICVVRASDGMIIFTAPQFERMFGYGTGELVGKHISTVNAPTEKSPQAVATDIMAELKRAGVWSGELQNIKKDGVRIWCHANVTSLDHHQFGQVWVTVHEDISERKRAESHMHELAFYDQLTGLPNRSLMNNRLGQMMTASMRSGRYCAALFVDLDNFKILNDTHGHNVGDLLLRAAADRLKNCVRECDTVSRFGGDEFVVLLGNLLADQAESTVQAGIVAEKMRNKLAEPYLLSIKREGCADSVIEHHCTASIGVVVFINHEAGQDDILRWADAAMYHAKDAGCNLIRFHDFRV